MSQLPLPLDDEGHPSDAESEIPGSKYLPGFLSAEEAEAEYEWLTSLPPGEWMRDLSRRVIHYGWRYDYTARTISEDLYLDELPERFADLAKRLHDNTGEFDEIPNQVIVNEYEPGQGIAMHTDHRSFGPAVATISLGDSWSMDFLHERTGRKQSRLLEVGSALVLSGEARLEWRHGIAKRKTEPDGRRRSTRISLTFRTVHSRPRSSDSQDPADATAGPQGPKAAMGTATMPSGRSPR